MKDIILKKLCTISPVHTKTGSRVVNVPQLHVESLHISYFCPMRDIKGKVQISDTVIIFINCNILLNALRFDSVLQIMFMLPASFHIFFLFLSAVLRQHNLQ